MCTAVNTVTHRVAERDKTYIADRQTVAIYFKEGPVFSKYVSVRGVRHSVM